MSRRTAIIEEFDDDTDLPLPAQALPNTGTRGPLLEEIHISDDDADYSQAGPSPSRPQFAPPPSSVTSSVSRPVNEITDATPYKHWTSIYPIYIDAKRPYNPTQRRIARQKSVWWPLSQDIAEAVSRLGLRSLHERQKSHPRDWENPGRVKVQWKREDGKLMNPDVKSKKQLLEMISFQIQHSKPDNVPKPPYIISSSTSPTSTNTANTTQKSTTGTGANTSSSTGKGKQSLTKSAALTVADTKAPVVPSIPTPTPHGPRLPVPPPPYPALSSRLSPFSPALESGVLVDTVKAGMNAAGSQDGAGGIAPGQGGPGGQIGAGGGKGKRKVVRVRG